MEVSSTLQRCAQRISARSLHWPSKSRTPSTSNSAQQYNTRSSIRTFSSTPFTQQDRAPQPIPVSNEKSNDEAVGALPSSADGLVKPNPRNRIDLSPLTKPSPYRPPGYTPPTSPNNTTSSPRQMIDALFPPLPREDRFTRAIRQTNILNSSSSSSTSTPKYIISELLNDLPTSKRDSKPESKLPLRLRPSLGRTLPVDTAKGVDVTRAFRQLDMKIAANNLKKDANAQRFHVRRGQARKLKRSLRWRVQFRAGFLEECARIRRMKNQGW